MQTVETRKFHRQTIIVIHSSSLSIIGRALEVFKAISNHSQIFDTAALGQVTERVAIVIGGIGLFKFHLAPAI
jgi:hypothetical protein